MIITLDMALEAIDLAVGVRGADYVDPATVHGPTGWTTGGECKYVRGGAPSCIIGTALAHLGVPLDALEEIDDSDDPTVGGGSDFVRILRQADVTFAQHVLPVLAVAQITQDSGHTWGLAQEKARQKAAEWR